jgi:DNA (cytosine-5)-methyltransferase 1
MNYLSLFTGAGGGDLAFQHLLDGFRCVGYVEYEEYCQKVIAQRIKDGLLDEAPIFGDIRVFNREGYSEAYQGMVELITGGFPCQDISCAGKGAGIHGERSGLWFEMRDTIRIIRPRYVFIENVPMLLIRGFEYVIGALFEMGYDAKWGIVSAADVGACHLRKRLWVVANAKRGRCGAQGECESMGGVQREGQDNAMPVKKPSPLANAVKGRLQDGSMD